MSLIIQGMAPLLQVFDMPTSLNFYRDRLGFQLVRTSGHDDNAGWVMLKFNDVLLMLNTQYEDEFRPKDPDPVRNKHHEDTILYLSCPDIQAAYNYFLSKGLNVKPPYKTGYGFNAVELTDPDGYLLCFQWEAE
jgi:glyoxylase I family protein